MDTLGTLILLARVTKDWKPEKNDGSLASHPQQAGGPYVMFLHL